MNQSNFFFRNWFSSDRYNIFLFATLATAACVFFIILFITYSAFPVLSKEGFGLITGTVWNYQDGQYGMFFFIVGTMILTATTMIIAFPISLFTAIYLSEWAPAWIAKPCRGMIELLVGIPSIVFGILGFLALRPVFIQSVNPAIGNTLGFIPLFRDVHTPDGNSILLTATVLTIMILPTVTILSMEAMRNLPKDLKEASLSLGANRWETIKYVILPGSLAGIGTAFILGMMRVMGETMAVVMLIGNSPHIPTSILDTGATMTGKILGDSSYWISFPEPRAALFSIAWVLMVIELVLVAVARTISSYYGKRYQ